MADVIAQHFLFDPAQGGADRRNLRYDVDAIAVFLDHAGETSDLALDAVEAFETGGFGLFLHP